MIDVKGAFDYVHKEYTDIQMESFDPPLAAICWVYHFLSGRQASLVVDGKITEVQPVNTGIPQGSPISPLLRSCLRMIIYLGMI
jgi:hypothetical protein